MIEGDNTYDKIKYKTLKQYSYKKRKEKAAIVRSESYLHQFFLKVCVNI